MFLDKRRLHSEIYKSTHLPTELYSKMCALKDHEDLFCRRNEHELRGEIRDFLLVITVQILLLWMRY